MKPVIPFTMLFLKTSAILFFVVVPALVMQAQPGTLDSSFGIDGKATVDKFVVAAVALQQDGKIVAVGSSVIDKIGIARFNPDGSPDAAFGDNGVIRLDLYPTHQFRAYNASDVAVQPDGKFLITGYGYFAYGHGNYSTDAFILRYNTDGSPDESFGDRGVVISDYSNSADEAEKIAIRPDGKIIIGGAINYAEYFIAQHNPDGSIDSSFGGRGSVRYGGDQFSSLALQQDGKIVISYNESGQVGSLVRFKTDGTKDSSFGINGTVQTEVAARNLIYDLLIQPDGKVLAAGESDRTLSKPVLVLLRFGSNGKPDTGFGDNGTVYTVDTAWIYANAVVQQPDQQIIIGGFHGDPSDPLGECLSIRYNKDGTLNDKYGDHGIEITPDGSINDIALQPDGKIIALAQGLDASLIVLRYNGEHQTDPEFAKIKKWLHKHGFTWDDFPHLAPGGSIQVERSSNGNIFTTIASIATHNNNQPYSFEDPAPLAGINYYRLTATAADGSNVSSNVIAIGNSDAASIKVFPNPVKNSLQVTGLQPTQKTTLSITDLSGAARAAVTVTGSSYNWNIGQLKAGSYILRIENGDLVVSKMFIKE